MVLQAFDVIAEARKSGQGNPDVLLGRLRDLGLSDDCARDILLGEGFEVDGLVDPRLVALDPPRRTRHGFVR
jgi:hypothetical protein